MLRGLASANLPALRIFATSIQTAIFLNTDNFQPFSPLFHPSGEKRKKLIVNHLLPIFIDFSRFLKKLFVSRLSRVPTLSHACPTHLVGQGSH
jgi:hypothetical protein